MRDLGSLPHRLVAVGLRTAADSLWCVEPESAALADLAPVDGVCIDLGAEFGLYSILLTSTAPRGTTIAVEPNPALGTWLRILQAMLGITGLELVHAGVGAEAAHVDFEIPRRRGRNVAGRGTVATVSGPNHLEFKAFRHIQVNLTTVDQIVEQARVDRVDIVKADIEGMEASMLDGATATIDRFRPVWLLEIEDRHLERFGRTSTEIFDKFRKQRYDCAVYSDRRWVRTTGLVPGHRNYLFTPRPAELD